MTEQAHTLEQGATSQVAESSDRKAAQLVYILQTIGLFIGLTFIAGVIVNYVKRGDLTSDLGRSHFRFQIRTFWFSFLWVVIGSVLSVVFIGYLILLADIVWVVYRIVKGWLRLNDGKAMYVKN